MPPSTALDRDMRSALDAIGHADVLVGIPSFNNAATIGHVARTVAEGLRASFPEMRAVVVNADGGSRDGTGERVRASLDGTPGAIGAYAGLPGKGSAFRAIFEAAGLVGARACAVVDSDLRSITPQWLERLLRPVIEGRADYVTPLYARHKHDGTITNTIAYPLTRALYGLGVRQPIGGEFGFSGALATDFLAGGALRSAEGEIWQSDVARFGIDIFMTTTALVRRARVVQAPLGAKVHDPKDPGADLGPMFTQVVGTAFRLAVANAEAWRDVRGSREAELSDAPLEVEPEPVAASVDVLLSKFKSGAEESRRAWEEALGQRSLDLIGRALEADGPPAEVRGEAWAQLVYELLLASRRAPARTEVYIRSLVPLYFGRVAALIAEAEGMSTSEAEGLVAAQARAFEARKDALREGWS